jgi:dTDP-4-dehydrorhamnose 3,5-epimerase-like enzyme
MSLSEHKILGDHRGKLVAIESNKDVPFEVKRVFYIYGTQPDVPRGNHSHYKTKQYLMAVSGSCKVTLDDGNKSHTYDLNTPNKGLLQSEMIWGTMHDFSEDCVLLVLASEHYDESDYIRDYVEFIEKIK